MPIASLLRTAVLAVAVLLAGPVAARAQAALPRATLFLPAPARLIASASPLPAALGPGRQCRLAIRTAERAAGIPNQLMAAIARIESGRREPDGSINPWPWSINVEGEDHVYDSKAEVIAAVRAFQARGARFIDVGCMQVNLLHHPDAFPTLEDAFDPTANAAYAAKFLLQLKDETGTWPTATAWYHSATPGIGDDYQRRVMAVWPEEQQRRDDPAPAAPAFASNYASGYSSGFKGGFANRFANGFGAPVPGSFAISNRAEAARIIPLAGGATGRGLAAYRAAPIAVVSRPAPLPPREAGRSG